MFLAFQGLIDAHEQFKNTLGEADKEYQGIMGLINECQRIAQQYGIQTAEDNPYTTLSPQVGEHLITLILTQFTPNHPLLLDQTLLYLRVIIFNTLPMPMFHP